ncbi:MAG: CAP domain-containing protein [Firmicutes bacterium]|nr:CAP domain-containing protein [Bacillota bacterium]
MKAKITKLLAFVIILAMLPTTMSARFMSPDEVADLERRRESLRNRSEPSSQSVAPTGILFRDYFLDFIRGEITEQELRESLPINYTATLTINDEIVDLDTFIHRISQPSFGVPEVRRGNGWYTATLDFDTYYEVLRWNDFFTQLPNRRLTEQERLAWVEEYEEFDGPTENEKEVMRLINEIRAEHGLRQLVWDDNLGMAARFYTQQLAQLDLESGHNMGPYANGEQGTHAPSGMRAASHEIARIFGGNSISSITNTRPTPKDAVNSWMGSPGHRAAILDPNTRTLGVGSFRSINLTGISHGTFNYTLFGR